MDLNPISQIKNELFLNKKRQYLTIKERAILLSFLRVLHLLEHLDKIDLFEKEFALNNEEIKQLIYLKLMPIKGLEDANNDNVENLSPEYVNKLRLKLSKAKDIEDLIEIYNQELISFPVK